MSTALVFTPYYCIQCNLLMDRRLRTEHLSLHHAPIHEPDDVSKNPGNVDTSRPIRSGDLIATGTGAARRRLTLEEAAAGGKPERMTPEEWAAMAKASKGEA